jgi:hypothetical protein
LEGDLKGLDICPYLFKAPEGFYCRASNWGFSSKMPEVGACFRPLTVEEVVFCLKAYNSCPDFKKAKFYEEKSKSEA